MKEALTAHAKDAQVVAFKSVVCYRSGLAVSVARSPQSDLAAFEEVFVKYKVQGNVRLAAKAVNDMVVRMALQIAGDFNKPGLYIPSLARCYATGSVSLRSSIPHGPWR